MLHLCFLKPARVIEKRGLSLNVMCHGSIHDMTFSDLMKQHQLTILLDQQTSSHILIADLKMERNIAIISGQLELIRHLICQRIL